MAYDEMLASRYRDALETLPAISEKKMMGGVCFLASGNMIGGCHRNKDSGEGMFMFRIGKENEEIGAARPEGIPVIMGSRRMPGFFHVTEEDCTDAVLAEWIALALSFVGTLPAKE